MRLDRVYVRFYKSFNYDFERRAKTGAARHEWEMTDAGWFPYVRLDLEPDITAIVGANEAGKSHMLGAIRALLTGEKIHRRDFCRYSTLYSVEEGQMRLPDFGGRFALGPADRALADALSMADATRLWFFRPGGAAPFVLDAEGGQPRPLDGAQLTAVEAALPVPFDVDTQTGLPDAVDLKALAGQPTNVPGRAARAELLSALDGGRKGVAELTALVPKIYEILIKPQQAETKEQVLGRKLLRDISGIGQQAFIDLVEAMSKGREGEVNALLQKMNEAIATHLNPQRWWSQDPDFKLRLGPREHELVLTIRDRTGTDYQFSERSRGLQFFLGYLVELQAHAPAPRQEILLMDEPDAYLSNAGQQDLLRVLEHYARPDDRSREDQVVYVTHSPFLINRNAGQRLRVLDKGRSEEGRA
jgi:predicted ATPase